MLGEEERRFLTAEGTEVVVAAFGIAAAYTGNALPVIAAREKVLSNCLDPFESKLPVCADILLITPAAEIGEMLMNIIWRVFFPAVRIDRPVCAVLSSALLPHTEL